MNPSVYSALMQALEEESEAVLPTDVAVKEPNGEIAPVVEDAAPEPVKPLAPPLAGTPEVPARTLGDKYGLDDLSDAQPAPRAKNDLVLPASLSRAGAKLGAALAGVKAYTSAGDSIEKHGAVVAQGQDKVNDDLTKFKQQLMLRTADARSKKGDGPLDPTAPEYLAAVAQIEGQPRTKAVWDRITARSKEFGVVPDPYRFLKDFKTGTAESQVQSDTNSLRSATQAGIRQDKGISFRREQDARDYAQTLSLRELDHELKSIKAAKDAGHPFRDFADSDSPPTLEEAKLVRRNDALAGQLNFLTKKLMNEIKTNSALDKKNPLANAVVYQTYQEILNIARDKENFGVPSHNDMEQLGRMIANPTTWMELVSGQGIASLQSLLDNNQARTEIFAQTNRFGPYGQKAGQTVGPNANAPDSSAWPSPGAPAPSATPKPTNYERVKKAVQRAKGAAAEAGTAIVGGVTDAVTEVSPDAEIDVVNENGDEGTVPASQIEAWLKENPKRRALR
jgi:hypothetical protein